MGPARKGFHIMHRTTVFLAFFAVMGCAQVEPQFVGVRDFPQSPSFVVFPLYDGPEQDLYAAAVERGLLGNGLKVLARPQRKEITARTMTQMQTAAESASSSVQGDGPLASASSAQQNVEIFQKFLDMGTQADFLVITQCRPVVADGRMSFISTNVRIIRRETNELLGSFPTSASREKESLGKALSALGILPEGSLRPAGPAEAPR